jgi:hypothetical protein
VQRIPHPMWRYQPSPTAHGAASWACHVGCHDYTNWRIVPDDVVRIPAQEVPESWGRRDEWLELIRASRTAEHEQRAAHAEGGAAGAGAGAGAAGAGEGGEGAEEGRNGLFPEGCMIM